MLGARRETSELYAPAQSPTDSPGTFFVQWPTSLFRRYTRVRGSIATKWVWCASWRKKKKRKKTEGRARGTCAGGATNRKKRSETGVEVGHGGGGATETNAASRRRQGGGYVKKKPNKMNKKLDQRTLRIASSPLRTYVVFIHLLHFVAHRMSRCRSQGHPSGSLLGRR